MSFDNSDIKQNSTNTIDTYHKDNRQDDKNKNGMIFSAKIADQRSTQTTNSNSSIKDNDSNASSTLDKSDTEDLNDVFDFKHLTLTDKLEALETAVSKVVKQDTEKRNLDQTSQNNLQTSGSSYSKEVYSPIVEKQENRDSNRPEQKVETIESEFEYLDSINESASEIEHGEPTPEIQEFVQETENFVHKNRDLDLFVKEGKEEKPFDPASLDEDLNGYIILPITKEEEQYLKKQDINKSGRWFVEWLERMKNIFKIFSYKKGDPI